jgi:hypothetical protein
MIARTGQLGQDSWDRTAREDSQGSTASTENREQYCHNRTARTGQGNRTTVTGQLAKNIWDRITQTGQPGQVYLDRIASHVSLRGQPGWVRT